MAGGNLSARQKMINMMYLVLTALLALNISKEVLHAFVVVNIGLNQQNENLRSKNEGTRSQFASEIVTNPKDQKRKELNEKAIQVGKLSQELCDFIEQMKVEMVMKTDGCPEDKAKERIKDPFKVDRKDDYDRPTNYFGTSDPPGTNGKANELKNKLAEYKVKLLSFVDAKNKAKVEKNLASINTEPPKEGETEGDNHSTWEMFYFYHQPQSAALVELTKWQNIVRGGESEILTYLWDQISATSFKFDAVMAAVIPKSNFVTSGSAFEAEAFLAAYSTAVKPKITYGTAADSTTGTVTGGTELPDDKIINGKGYISVPASGAGERTFGVSIRIVNPVTGAETPYVANCKYNVAPPSATVSATKMNVMYKGLDNPIEVSVPGVAPNQISVNCSGASMTGGNGKYVCKPGAGKEVVISVSAKTNDGKSTSMGSYKFRVKPVPTPKITWVNQTDGGMVGASAGAGSPLIPRMEDFDFDVYSTITSFEIGFKLGGDYYVKQCTGNTIPGDVAAKIRGLGRGTTVSFSSVKMTVPGGDRRSASASFKIQ
jgi:gliding motility-associated protein GldM